MPSHKSNPFWGTTTTRKCSKGQSNVMEIIQEGWNRLQVQTLYEAQHPPLRTTRDESSLSLSSLDVLIPQPLATTSTLDMTYRQRKSRCKYCKQKGHFNYQCQNPHQACNLQRKGKCVVPGGHPKYRPSDIPICCYQGVHSVKLFTQRLKGGLADLPRCRKKKRKEARPNMPRVIWWTSGIVWITIA
jgi:hypothetical protein